MILIKSSGILARVLIHFILPCHNHYNCFYPSLISRGTTNLPKMSHDNREPAASSQVEPPAELMGKVLFSSFIQHINPNKVMANYMERGTCLILLQPFGVDSRRNCILATPTRLSVGTQQGSRTWLKVRSIDQS